MKKKYGHNILLLFTATDSLMSEVSTNDFYQDIWPMKEEFEIAIYQNSRPFYADTNNKVGGES